MHGCSNFRGSWREVGAVAHHTTPCHCGPGTRRQAPDIHACTNSPPHTHPRMSDAAGGPAGVETLDRETCWAGCAPSGWRTSISTWRIGCSRSATGDGSWLADDRRLRVVAHRADDLVGGPGGEVQSAVAGRTRLGGA